MSRLFCSGLGAGRKFVVAESLAVAEERLAGDARLVTADDLRLFWQLECLDGLTCQAVADRFAVTKQTASNWRRRAFGDDGRLEASRERHEMIARLTEKGMTTREIIELSGASKSIVYNVARRNGLKLKRSAPYQKRPEDGELLKLAKGKTWRELAAACGVRLATLRMYLYARPELMSKVRPLLVLHQNKVRLTDEQVRQMWLDGQSAYKISEATGASQMAVYARLHKLGLREANYAMRRGENEPS